MKSAGFALFAAMGLLLSLSCSSSSKLGPDAGSDAQTGTDQAQQEHIGQLDIGPEQLDLATDSTSDTVGEVAGDVSAETVPGDAGNDVPKDVLSDLPADVPPDVCQPSCLGKVCGEDGCGGSCGECGGPQDACELGQCVCKPWCGEKECDGDGCGGSCGSCGEHFVCEAGFCEYQPWCGDGVCDVDLLEECSACPADCPCGCGEACTEGACVFTAAWARSAEATVAAVAAACVLLDPRVGTAFVRWCAGTQSAARGKRSALVQGIAASPARTWHAGRAFADGVAGPAKPTSPVSKGSVRRTPGPIRPQAWTGSFRRPQRA